MEAYKLADIAVLDDAVAMLRRRRELYLGAATPGADLAGRLMHDLALLDALPASLSRDGAWWVVTAARDWLRAPSGEVSTEPFFRIVACPRWGHGAFRAEVLVTAFAEAVVTTAGTDTTWIAGAAGPLPGALRAPQAGRALGYRMPS